MGTRLHGGHQSRTQSLRPPCPVGGVGGGGGERWTKALGNSDEIRNLIR